MLNLKAVLEAIEGLIRHTESELERLQKELAKLREDRDTILQYLETTEAAQEVAQRYGKRQAVPEAVQRFAQGIVPAFTKFLVQAWQDGRTFPSRTALAKAAVADSEIGQRYSTWRSLAKPEVLTKLLEEVRIYVLYLFEQDEENLRSFLRYLEDLRAGFPPLKGEKKQTEEEKVKKARVTRPYWYGGREDPLRRVDGGGKVAALTFAAILPVRNGRCDHDRMPATREELIECMRCINEETDGRVKRIDLMQHGFGPLEVAIQAAIQGDYSYLGEARVEQITKVWKFASVEAFYQGHFLPLMQGREVSKHRPDVVEIDPERHLAVASED